MTTIELSCLKSKKVLVVGDLMLDTYHIGDVKRISPEAPVPVVRVNRSYSVLGGASNVARNLLGLGCTPYVIGLLGNDHNGKVMQDMFTELGINALFGYTEHPTITKTRIIGNNQQVVRVDFEQDRGKLSPENEQYLLDAIQKTIPLVDIIVISDYGKGVCNETICKQVISTARSHQKQVVVDPKGFDWDKYRGATIITPNLKEISDIFGAEIKNKDEQIHQAAQEVIEKYDLASLLVTRSEKGMSYIDTKIAKAIPTEAQEVYDVSGAGDTVVATLAAALAAEFPVLEAIYIANKAAGVVVGKMGTCPITFDELQSELTVGKPDAGIVSFAQLPDLIKQLKRQNRKIVFTNGCFDILHKGHVTYLEKAKKMGDILVVGLNSDSSVKRLKGESRPINDEQARGTVLSALACIDYVVIFSDDTPLKLIETVRPDILVKGGDYEIENIVGREYAKETVVIPFVEGFSTTNTINSMNNK